MNVSPRVVGRYVVHAEIAAGGMATVHVGRLLGPVGFARTVAIKRLHPHFAKDPEFVAMFLDEARLAARVRHPNVVQVLDVVAEGGELFLVMEYVEGESLSRLISGSRRGGHAPPWHIAAAIVAQSLHGLHAAHEAVDERGQPLSIVHRDMSPQNVLVGTEGVARVLDFGVAKAVGRAQITREGELKGKLPYMAPEQVKRGSKVSRRTDVYAAGVVLWEALTARRLFSGDDQGEILSAVLEGTSDAPSKEEPTVPRALDEITMRALRRDPDARFATAREMALAIESAIGVVHPSEIGAWAAQLAYEGLADRARAVAEIESSPGIVTAYATPLLEETGTLPVVIPPDPMDDMETLQQAPVVDPMDAIDSLVTVPRPASVIVAQRAEAETERTVVAPSRTGYWLAGAAILTLLSVLAGVLLARRPLPEVVVPAGASPVPKPVASLDSKATEEPPPQELPPIEIPSASASVAIKKPQPTVKQQPFVPKGNCNPPYYYENGIKRFKPNCL